MTKETSTIFGFLRTQPGKDRSAFEKVAGVPGVTEAYMTNNGGAYDMIIKIISGNGIDTKSVLDKVSKVDGVSGASYHYSLLPLL